MTCTEFAADDRIYKQLNFSNKEKIFTNVCKQRYTESPKNMRL